jgi:hypothetical protein
MKLAIFAAMRMEADATMHRWNLFPVIFAADFPSDINRHKP